MTGVDIADGVFSIVGEGIRVLATGMKVGALVAVNVIDCPDEINPQAALAISKTSQQKH